MQRRNLREHRSLFVIKIREGKGKQEKRGKKHSWASAFDNAYQESLFRICELCSRHVICVDLA